MFDGMVELRRREFPRHRALEVAVLMRLHDEQER
jgi:hypothetical protein